MANDYTSLINGNEEFGISLTSDEMPIAEEHWTRNESYDWSSTYDDEQYSTIDEKKIITVNENQINVAQEAYGQFIPFKIPRYYDKIDLAQSSLSIHYIRKRPEGNTFVEEGEEVRPINVQYNDTELRFGWLIDGKVTSYAGEIDFEIIARGQNSLGQSYVWKTQPLKKGLNIIESLEPGAPIVIDDSWMGDIVAGFAEAVQNAELNLENFVKKDELELELGDYATNDNLEAIQDHIPTGIELYINDKYELYAQMTTGDGTILQSKTIDLPIESMVADASYDDENKTLTITLANGTEIEVPVGDIISGDLTNYYTKAETYSQTEVNNKLNDYALKTHVEARLGELGTKEGEETLKTVVEYVAEAIATALTNYYSKNEVYTKTEVDSKIDTKIGNLGSYTPEGGAEPVDYTVAQRFDKVDGDITATNSRFGELGSHTDEGTGESIDNTVVDYVEAAIKRVDVTDQLEDYAKTEDVSKRIGDIPTEKTVKDYVDEAEKTIKDYVDEAVKTVDLTDYYTKEEIATELIPYITEDEFNERIGREITDDTGNPMSLVDYIDSKAGTNSAQNYYKATYGKTEINGVETENIFTLWKASEDFNPEQPGEVEITPVSQFEIVGGTGTGSSLSKLYLYFETNPSNALVKNYTYREEDVADKKAIVKYSFKGEQANGQEISVADGVWAYRQKISNDTYTDWKNIKTTVLEPTPDGEYNSFNVSEYLTKNATYQFKLTASDDSGASSSITWTVSRTAFYITVDFNDDKIYPIKDTYLNYVPVGANVEKTIHLKFDNIETTTTTSYSGKTMSWLLPILDQNALLRHGSHQVEIWMTATFNGVEMSSEHIYKDIMFYDPARTKPIVGCSPLNYSINQYSTLNIKYNVYDPSSTQPKVFISVDSEEPQERTLEGMTNYYSFKADNPGTHTVTFTCYDPTGVYYDSDTVTIQVNDLDYDIGPVPNATIDFNPAGKDNSEVTFNQDGTAIAWTNKAYSLITTDNFDWVNGGYQSDYDSQGFPIPGSEHFLIKAGTFAELSYKFFGGEGDGVDPTAEGRDFKLVFKTQKVEKSNAQFVTCVNDATGQKIGLEMNVHEAYVYSGADKLHLQYSEEDIIEFGFKISSNDSKVKTVTGYEDGVATRVKIYDNSDSFVQKVGNRQNIKFGSNDCDLLIYRLKIYENELTDEQILTNFIADARTGEEMVARYERNQIYDPEEGNKLTPEYLSKVCPWLRVISISAPTFTTGKESSDAVMDSTIEYRYGNGEKEGTLSYWKCTDAVHVGQGTSSNYYGASGRNIDLVLKEYKDRGNNPIIYLGEGEDAPTTSKVALSKTSIPNNYFNIKVNIASSENANNALLAKRFNEYQIFKRPFADSQYVTIQDEDGKNIRIAPKDTMEFFNCVVFIRETAETGHTEFNDDEFHFYAIGNIGDSKKTDKTRLTDKNDDYECCLEIMDVKRPLADFPKDTIVNAMVQNDDGEYLYATDENLKAGLLLEKQADGSYVVSTDTTIDETKIYYIDGRASEDFSEKFTYGWRYIKEYEYDPADFKTGENTDEEAAEAAKAASDAKNKEIMDYCAEKWWELYDFITNSTDTEFHDNFEKYFVRDSALYYYLFTERYTMVDNRAKNSFWHYGKIGQDSEGNPIRRWDLNWGYDMDTALGTDNDGNMVYRYGLEDIDVDEKGVEVFRESDSTFFRRLRNCFAGELSEKYGSINNAWKATDLINKFDNWQSEFPEELWRLDIQRKYIRPATGPIDNSVDKGIDAKYLRNMTNGRKKYQRRQFERNQELYMASKYRSPAASSSDNQIVLRCASVSGDDSVNVVPQNFNIKLTPFTYMYLFVKQGSGSRKERVTELFDSEGKPKEYPFTFTGGTDFVEIDSAHWIQSLGDISAMYPSSVSAPTAKKLKELIIGSHEKITFDDGSELSYYNRHMTELTIGANELLEKLNIENVGYEDSLDLSELTNLREVYAEGSAISGITCANGGELRIAKLPAINTITMNNLKELQTFTLESYDKLSTINIANCPTLDTVDLVNKAANLSNARIIGVDWHLENADILAKLYGLSDYNGTGKAVVEGYVYVETIKEKELALYNDRWKKLTIEPKVVVPQFEVTFKNPDGYVWKDYTQWVVQDQFAIEPDFTPVLDPTDELRYTFAYWRLEGTNVPFDFNTPITKNITLIAEYSSDINTYTVRYYNSYGNVIQETIGARYGSYVPYTGEEFSIGINTEGSRVYKFFTGWDKSGYVTGDKDIYPMYEEFIFTDGFFSNNELKDLTPAQLFALTTRSGMASEIVSNYKDYGANDVINLPMGEEYNNYTDLKQVRYTQAEKTYNGTSTYNNTGDNLFDVDRDFVFAIDYTMAPQENGVLCANYAQGYGFKLKRDGGKQVLEWGDQSKNRIELTSGALREMLVLEHAKGSQELKIYFSDKENDTIKTVTLTGEEFISINTPLVFGAESQGADYGNYCAGTIHWAKKFEGLLGDEQCRKMASWTHETIQMFPCFYSTNSQTFAQTYPIADSASNEFSKLTFMSTNVMEIKKAYGDGDTWSDSAIRNYLKNRIFNGVNSIWKNLLKRVNIQTQSHNDIETTSETVFMPSYFNLYPTNVGHGTAQEGNVEKQITFFGDKPSNIATLPDGTAKQYWTRTTKRSTLSTTQAIYIDEEGQGKLAYTYNLETKHIRFMISM